MSQRPSVSRAVHYVSRGSADGRFPSVCRAATITAVDDYELPAVNADGLHIGSVDLAVLNPGGLFFDRGVLHDETDKAGGTWHWPERVD